MWESLQSIPWLFTWEASYIRSYIWVLHDRWNSILVLAGIFAHMESRVISFLHNVLSIVLIRIPGAYFASKWFIDTLYPMGCAAPAGSLLSVIVCGIAFIYLKRRRRL